MSSYAEIKDSKTCFDLNEQCLNLEQEIEELQRYKEAYNFMCDETWDLIPDEEKANIHLKLKQILGEDKQELQDRIDKMAVDCIKATKKMTEKNRRIAEANRKKD